MKSLNLILFILVSVPIYSQKTEIRFLSGTGADNQVKWQFFCSDGMNSGKWTSIAVPSCREQEGFGIYNFGRDRLEDHNKETGIYKYNFTVPSAWKSKQIYIVFDGVMTDAEVKINRKPAGPGSSGSILSVQV